jgi:hypothetical protein
VVDEIAARSRRSRLDAFGQKRGHACCDALTKYGYQSGMKKSPRNNGSTNIFGVRPGMLSDHTVISPIAFIRSSTFAHRLFRSAH